MDGATRAVARRRDASRLDGASPPKASERGLLVTTVVGSGIMGEKLAGGNVALALLGNTLADRRDSRGADPGARADLRRAFQSGRVARDGLPQEHPWREFLPYAAAQIVGGCLGTLVAHGMFELPLFELAIKARTGPAQWFAEFVATFGLIVTILGGVALQERGDSGRGRSLHHGGLLVHRVHVVRQSGRHDRPRADRQLFRHCAGRRADVHRRAIVRRSGRPRA